MNYFEKIKGDFGTYLIIAALLSTVAIWIGGSCYLQQELLKSSPKSFAEKSKLVKKLNPENLSSNHHSEKYSD